MGYTKGIIGGVIGGLIATIPWILLYVYGGFMFSLLAALVAFGANIGYRFLKGPIDKKLPIIISVISVLSVVFVTLLVIPILMLMDVGAAASLENLQYLYTENPEFVAEHFKNLAIAIVFTFIGIAGVIRNIKDEINGVRRVEVIEKIDEDGIEEEVEEIFEDEIEETINEEE